MRYFFEISYKGTHYHGWQIQKNAVSIQQIINESLEILLQEKVETIGSSRTDTGVHARQQFFHMDSPRIRNTEKLKFRLNSFLPNDISIRNILPVKSTANCRFDAISRSYEYLITRVKNPFLSETAIELHRSLNVDQMNKATRFLIGEQNFRSFCRNSAAVENHHCFIKKAVWKESPAEINFQITSNRFLRGMVRSIVGTLLLVGDGSLKVGDFRKIINAQDRTLAGPAAPAKGLCLIQVKYPASVFKA